MQTPPSAALLLAWRFARSRLHRLQTGTTTGLLFLTLAILCSEVENIPQRLEKAGELGSDAFLWHWLSKTLVSNFILAAVTLLVLRISAPNGWSMTQKPMRFLASLAVGTALGVLASWQLGVSLGRLPSVFAANMDWKGFYSAWTNSLLWGGLFGWMYFLYLRRKEDQVRFGMLLGRRALLARQLSQSLIVAARAQVDPAMVVRILREVRARYAHDAPEASTLMDHMVDYLRLALHRVRDVQPMLAKELPLLRAYLALREAETGRRLRLSGDQSVATRPAGPVFLVARDMLDIAIQATQSDLDMRITIATDHTVVELRTGGEALMPAQLERLAGSLNARILGGADVAQHLVIAGQHSYTVHVPIV
jgi:hypothetical protein